MYERKAAGYQVRSRAQWVEKGEKSTSYFLGLEKARQNSNCIECLKESNGDKHNSRHKYIVEEMDRDFLSVRKLIGSAFRSKLYKLRYTEIFPVPLQPDIRPSPSHA